MKINGIEISHLKVTLKNELICRAAYTKAKEFTQSKNVDLVLRNINRLRNQHEDLAEMIDEIGMINKETVKIHAQRLKDNHLAGWLRMKKDLEDEDQAVPEYEPMTDDAALASAEAEIQENLKVYLKDNLNIGKSLYFDAERFPESLDALKIGIEILKETIDRSSLSEDEIQKIDSEISSDFWQNVSASEVADYVTKFCKSFR
jgi:hypothetical protein